MNLAKVLDLPIDIYEIIFAFEGRFFPLKNGKWICKLNLEKYIFLNRKLKTMIQQPSIQWTDNVKKWTFICIDCMHTNKTRHLILKKHITMINTSVLITYISVSYTHLTLPTNREV